ncbi:hypothetical protein COOONC_08620 [Cooperia oncophora]
MSSANKSYKRYEIHPKRIDSKRVNVSLSVTYSIGVKGVTFNWDTYTKGCASILETTQQAPNNTCYDISTTDKATHKQVRLKE